MDSDREGVVVHEPRGAALRKPLAQQRLELGEPTALARELRVRLRKRRRSGFDDLPPLVAQLESKPVQEEDGAAVRRRVGVASRSVVDEVLARRIEPGRGGRKSI